MNRYTKQKRGEIALSIVGFLAWGMGWHVRLYRRGSVAIFLQIEEPHAISYIPTSPR